MTANVLIVDDLEANVKVLEAKLHNEYYTVFTANNGVEALEKLKQHSIDVVLLDCMMPEMDGFEACQKIKSNPETMDIPVVIITALSDMDDRLKGLDAGADEFLTKPVNDIALFSRLKSLVRIKSLIDELKLRHENHTELSASLLNITETLANSSVLIIDDDVIQAKHLKTAISPVTKNVKVFSKMENIVARIEAESPDAVVISCNIPDMDPLRLVQALKSNKESLRHLSIMLMAEEDNMTVVLKGLEELGANDYFITPFEKNEVVARITTQLKRKLYQDALRAGLEAGMNQSIKDSLTGIYNRRYFDKVAEMMLLKAQEEEESFHIFMIDIDHFKEVNDVHKHKGGDDVIKAVALKIQALFRVKDIVARYGGEEFAVAIISPNEAIATIGERIRQAIAELEIVITGTDNKVQKTVSIGIATQQEGESFAACMERADKALYSAKESGRNKVVVD